MRSWLIPVAAVLCFVFAALQVNPLVGWAERHNREVAVSGAGIYISLRAINAALSVAQEVEVGGSLGVTASIRPLTVLDPVDDTVERLSTVIFTVAIVSAVLAVGLQPLSVVGLMAAGVGLTGMAIPRCPPLISLWSRRALSIGIFLAVICPAIFALGSALGQAVTEPAWEEARAELSEISERAGAVSGVEEIGSAVPEQGSGLFDGMTELARSADRIADATGYFLTNADEIFEAGLTLVAVILLRVVVLPMVLLWLSARMLSALIGPRPAPSG